MAPSNIQVHARLRPHKPSDGLWRADALQVKDKEIKAINPRGNAVLSFRLEHCHAASNTQGQVFAQIEPLIKSVFEGTNACVFAYGVTGSGKTHTMEGTPADPGVIPRAVAGILQRKTELADAEMEVSFSYVEILKDEVYDLLGDRTLPHQKLDVRTDETGATSIIGRAVIPIRQMDEFVGYYRSASKARKTASTGLNDASSRSHAILTIHLDILQCGERRLSEICLVDLAGSENNNLTGNNAERMRESATINKSLTALGNVIDQLRRGAGHVSYRDSKLTRILSHALGGTSKTLLLVCLAPGEKYAKDTINTLKFADRASQVINTIPLEHRLPAPRQSILAQPRRSMPIGVQRGRQSLTRSSGMAKPKPSAARKISVLAEPPSHAQKGQSGVPRLGVLSESKNAGNAPDTVADAATSTEKPQDSMPRPIGGSKGSIWGHETIRKMTRVASLRINAPSLASPGPTNTASDQFALTPIAREDPAPAPAPAAACDEASREPEAVEVPVEELDHRGKRIRAGVLADKARKEQRAGHLPQALELYQAALTLCPGRLKLEQRIVEIQLELGVPLDKVSADAKRLPTLAHGVRRLRDEADSDAVIGQSPPVRRRLDFGRATRAA